MKKPQPTVSKPLTPRQRAFVKEWLANGGNGTQAALKAYGCTTDNSAAVHASRLLRNPKVQAEIAAGLAASELTSEKIVEMIAKVLKGGLNATKFDKAFGAEMPDHSTRLKGVEMALKLLGVFD